MVFLSFSSYDETLKFLSIYWKIIKNVWKFLNILAINFSSYDISIRFFSAQAFATLANTNYSIRNQSRLKQWSHTIFSSKRIYEWREIHFIGMHAVYCFSLFLKGKTVLVPSNKFLFEFTNYKVWIVS